jgi:ADP-ribose pyrophosphatase YjhB (NUDIX family)
VAVSAGILARGPWEPEQVRAAWRPDPYEPDRRETHAADLELSALRERGSPSHDGLAARLVGYEAGEAGLSLELQPVRWALRLNPSGGARSLSALTVVRDADGRWLAGRRAEWLSSWAGRWALGAGGAVEVDENPADTLARELAEEWSVEAERLRVEALVLIPNEMVLLVGQAWLAPGAEVTPDDEHDTFAWWPAEIDDWPPEADPALRGMGRLLEP